MNSKKFGALEAASAASGGDQRDAFQEVRMSEAKSNSIAAGAGLVKEAELWMGAQRDLLAAMETMISGWARRQRRAYETSTRSMQKICEARNVFDLVQAQHQLLSDCLDWTVSEIRAVGSEIPTITRTAVDRFGEAGTGLQRDSSSPQSAPSISVERAAAE